MVNYKPAGLCKLFTCNPKAILNENYGITLHKL